MDLATLRSTSSSGSNSSSLQSASQYEPEEEYSNETNISHTIKNFILGENVLETENNHDTSGRDEIDSCTGDDNSNDINIDKKSEQFLSPEPKVERGTGPRALRRTTGSNADKNPIVQL